MDFIKNADVLSKKDTLMLENTNLDTEYRCHDFIYSKGFTLLHHLIILSETSYKPNNKYKKINNLIKKYLEIYPEEINKVNNKGWSALHLVVANSYVDGSETVTILCKSKADINIQNNNGETALMLAIGNSKKDSRIQTINNLLMFSANINTQNKYGYTALMYAVESKDIEVVDSLCKYNTVCNINIKNNDGNTALMLALRYAYYTNETLLRILTRLLMLCNADINIKNNEGYNALMFTLKCYDILRNPEDIKTVKLLLEYDAKPSKKKYVEIVSVLCNNISLLNTRN